MDASEIRARRLDAKAITSKSGEKIRFPIAGGTAKLLGTDHEFRESTLRQDELGESEEFREELQGSSIEPQPSETKDDAEARNDFWSIEGDFFYRHHVEPLVRLMCQQKNHSQYN